MGTKLWDSGRTRASQVIRVCEISSYWRELFGLDKITNVFPICHHFQPESPRSNKKRFSRKAEKAKQSPEHHTARIIDRRGKIQEMRAYELATTTSQTEAMWRHTALTFSPLRAVFSFPTNNGKGISKEGMWRSLESLDHDYSRRLCL
ncbi:hypothetical protein B9Z55_013479 [Caenorhabditis nigoni]|nr:hypothetical protein B9Z55_013479 [Caenorhabditis nigoni]